jgi:hypothetical protein
MLAGEVSRGESFERPIGHGLVFRLASAAGGVDTGWDIEIVPEPVRGAKEGARDAQGEFSAIATPPYHFYNERYIEAIYDVTAEEAVGINPREFWFVESADDEKAAAAAVDATIYTSDPERRDKDAEARARKIALGSGDVRILKSRITKGKGNGDLGAIEWIRFEVHIQFSPGAKLGDVLFGANEPATRPIER